MFLRKDAYCGAIAITGALFLLAQAQVGMCQTDTAEEGGQSDQDTLDEIVVYGKRTLRSLRHDMYRAEEEFYDLFNLLNADDENDVHCYYRRPTKSHIRRRTCSANFVKEIYADSTIGRRLRQGGGAPDALVRLKHRQMLDEMEQLVAVHPELHTALMQFSNANQMYKSETKRRCSGKIICW